MTSEARRVTSEQRRGSQMNSWPVILCNCPCSSLRHAGLLLLAVMAGLSLLAGACKPSSATDREEGLEELRTMEQTNAAHAPPITLSEAVGCDVCPGWCRYEDLHRKHLPELFRNYREHADYLYGRRKHDLKRMVAAKHHLHRTACVVKRSGPDTWKQFLSFMDEQEPPEVRLATADLALEHKLALARPLQLLDTLWRKVPEDLMWFAWGLSDKWRFNLEFDPPKDWREPSPAPTTGE